MITRIVKLSIKEEHWTEFESVFLTNHDKIGNQSGCHSVELLRDENNPHLFFTKSSWDNQESLNAYRNSELFGMIWPKVKKWFNDKPEAWSLTSLKN